MFVKKQDLDDAHNKYTKNHSLSALNEAKNVRDSGNKTGAVVVFLSHKHGELDILEKVISVIRLTGANVYIDWIDDGMPENPSGLTAKKIKNAINSCQKFIYIATVSAISSKWCNWELGYGDAYKNQSGDLAIFPICENTGHWNGSEYLQIYPHIEQYQDHQYIYHITISGKKISLINWLNQL